MSMLLNPFIMAASVYQALPYALVYNSANISITAAVTLTFNSEVVDAATAHDTGSNTSRLTVPSAWNGKYGRISCNARADIGQKITMWKNGAIFRGAGCFDVGNFNGDDNWFSLSAPFVLTTGDYYELRALGSAAGNYLASDFSWFQIEVLRQDFSGCMAYNSTIQACGAGATITLGWDTESYDVGGWHSTVTNNNRMTVPSGVTLVRISGSAKTDATESGQIAIQGRKNGTAVVGCPYADMESSNEDGTSIVSAPLACTAGDYFDMSFYNDSASDCDNDEEAWFAIEALPSDLKYALVHRTTDFSITNGVPTIVNWNGETVDTDGWHDTGSNTSRLTVPTGVTLVRLTYNLQGQNVAGEWGVEILKNGSTFIGSACSDTNTGSIDQINGMTAILAVTPGDYFELRAYTNVASQSVESANGLSWFAIEEVRDTV